MNFIFSVIQRKTAVICAILVSCVTLAAGAKPGKVVLIAGNESHGYGAHEFNAGVLLLQKLLKEASPSLETSVHLNGWPKDPAAFDGASAIMVFCNGGGNHLFMPRLEEVDALVKKGVGVSCFHYAVETPNGDPGKAMLDWIGGYFEPHWSVNPHWTAEFKSFPPHPITRGVKPFSMNDEWYFHMRFRENMEGVTPILSAHPPKETMKRGDGPHSGNPHVRAAMERGEAQHVAWAYERPDGGRGFGFTGAHYHWNWADDNFRKLALNAILWTAKITVPIEGVQTHRPSLAELKANQDYREDAKRIPKNLLEEK
ncbi:MAG: type 1 glutamine amidotransferase [Limisphaerales bacterium]|jgi:type 1 glutamine amidotransferase